MWSDVAMRGLGRNGGEDWNEMGWAWDAAGCGIKYHGFQGQCRL